MNYITKAYRNSATFSGRATRKEYWTFALIDVVVVCAIITALAISILDYHNILSYISAELYIILLIPTSLAFFSATILPFISITVRRLHDSGCSGWLALMLIFPPLWIILFVPLTCPSTKGFNAYGPSPLSLRNGEMTLEEFGAE